MARRRPGERRRSAASAPQLRQNSTVYFGPLFPMVLVVTALLPRSQECRARATGTDTDSEELTKSHCRLWPSLPEGQIGLGS